MGEKRERDRVRAPFVRENGGEGGRVRRLLRHDYFFLTRGHGHQDSSPFRYDYIRPVKDWNTQFPLSRTDQYLSNLQIF